MRNKGGKMTKCRSLRMQVFEGNAPPGHIKIDSIIKALTTYGSEQLTEEQAHDLVSQVRVVRTILIIVSSALLGNDKHNNPPTLLSHIKGLAVLLLMSHWITFCPVQQTITSTFCSSVYKPALGNLVRLQLIARRAHCASSFIILSVPA